MNAWAAIVIDSSVIFFSSLMDVRTLTLRSTSYPSPARSQPLAQSTFNACQDLNLFGHPVGILAELSG
jgi:hypothetical protein